MLRVIHSLLPLCTPSVNNNILLQPSTAFPVLDYCLLSSAFLPSVVATMVGPTRELQRPRVEETGATSTEWVQQLPSAVVITMGPRWDLKRPHAEACATDTEQAQRHWQSDLCTGPPLPTTTTPALTSHSALLTQQWSSSSLSSLDLWLSDGLQSAALIDDCSGEDMIGVGVAAAK